MDNTNFYNYIDNKLDNSELPEVDISGGVLIEEKCPECEEQLYVYTEGTNENPVDILTCKNCHYSQFE